MLDAAAVVLAQYPTEVITQVTHPVSGLPGRLKWPPNIAEIREACELAVAPIFAKAERERREALAREEAAAARRREAERPARASLEELRARYGPNWGINPPPEPIPPALKHYRRDRTLTPAERQAMYAERRKNAARSPNA